MDLIESRIRRFSFNQLRSLSLLSSSKHGLVSSVAAGRKMGVNGKALGGVFSSLSRQRINGQPMVVPFGRGVEGRGLRWKLNTELISQKRLKEIVSQLLRFWEK